MVEINDLIGSNYVNVDGVKNAKDRRIVIISEGEIVDTKWGNTKLQLEIQMDTETKTWMLNQETLRNLREQWGSDSKNWVGKMVMLSTTEKNGKRYVVGFPI
jgi:hypothetical protein